MAPQYSPGFSPLPSVVCTTHTQNVRCARCTAGECGQEGRLAPGTPTSVCPQLTSHLENGGKVGGQTPGPLRGAGYKLLCLMTQFPI